MPGINHETKGEFAGERESSVPGPFRKRAYSLEKTSGGKELKLL
jgi:hypothetical protein